MDLTIEHVESLTLNFPNADARPSLANLISGLAVSVERGQQCTCPACTARRASEGTGKAPAADTASRNVTAIPRIGQQWPGQGGVNVGLMRGTGDSPDYYLIAAAGPQGGVASIKWAGDACDSDSTEATHANDGLANTRHLVGSGLDFPAAKWASGITVDGHSDFYLPSRRELALCEANVPEIFDKGYHWSSTQYSRIYAWSQHFDDGSQYGNDSSAELRARAVRRFIP